MKIIYERSSIYFQRSSNLFSAQFETFSNNYSDIFAPQLTAIKNYKAAVIKSKLRF